MKIEKDKVRKILTSLLTMAMCGDACYADVERISDTIDQLYPSRVYTGDEGRETMKADIKEIMHACGDEFDFLALINEAKAELAQEAWERQQENMIQQ